MDDPARRRFLLSAAGGGAAALLASCDTLRSFAGRQTPARSNHTSESNAPPDFTLRIGPVVAEIAKDHAIGTVGYNGVSPSPLIRLKEGVPVNIEIVNQTDSPELVHWHGLMVTPDVDGALEENSLPVPARGSIRYRLTPLPSGARFVRSHSTALSDLSRGNYSGRFAPVYVEPRDNPGHYDQEIFLTLHEWEPFFTSRPKQGGWEVAYRMFTINGKCLGHGEPLRVKQGQRVLFHIVNAGASQTFALALPGHHFHVAALDGYAVPKPQSVDIVQLAAGERVDAFVDMSNPGVWVLGSPNEDRQNGMGMVVEYAGRNGVPVWVAPPNKPFTCALFGDARPPENPDEVVPLAFGKIGGGPGNFNLWTVNGKSFEEKDAPRALRRDRRYRLIFENRTGEPQPVHLHRAAFEIKSENGIASGGVVKDVVLVGESGKVEVDVVPSIAGPSLFHCCRQLQMDFGLKFLFNVI